MIPPLYVFEPLSIRLPSVCPLSIRRLSVRLLSSETTSQIGLKFCGWVSEVVIFQLNSNSWYSEILHDSVNH